MKVAATILVLLLAGCGTARPTHYECESGHTLEVTYSDSAANVRIDDQPLEFAKHSEGRFVAGARELRVDAEGPRIIESDQVTVWGCRE